MELDQGGLGGQFNFGSLGLGQAFKEVVQARDRIDAVTAANAQTGVNDQAMLAGLGVPHVQKVLLAPCRNLANLKRIPNS